MSRNAPGRSSTAQARVKLKAKAKVRRQRHKGKSRASVPQRATLPAWAASAWTPDEIARVAEAVWNQATPGTNCAPVSGKAPLPKEDCNCYVKNACRQLVTSLSFDAPSYDADAILSALAATGSGWTAVGKDPDRAIASAAQGLVVVAGMSSSELSEAHGHLAVVIVGKEASGTLQREMPLCCAGALNPSARVYRRGVHFTFPVRKALSIRYFTRQPDRAVHSGLLEVATPLTLL
jgi:hypothetical protein